MAESADKPKPGMGGDSRELAQAFEHAPVGMAIADIDARIVHANAALANMLGYTRPEIVGKSVRDLTHPDDLADSLAQTTRVRSGDVSHFALEKRYLHKLGHVVWARVHVSRLTPASDASFLLHVEDITREKSAEKALHDTQERFREMAEAIDQDFWMMSLEPLKLLYASPAAARIWGFNPLTIGNHPQNVAERIHPEDAKAFGQLFGSLLGGTREREYRIVRPDGTIRWLRSRVFPVKDASGTVYRIAGVTEDITARKEAEEEIQRHRAVEQLVLKLTTEFVNLPAERMQEGFEMALGELGKLIGADRGAILLLDEESQTMAAKYRWSAEGASAPPNAFNEFPFGNLERETLVRGGLWYVESVDAMPAEQQETRDRLLANGIGSFIDVPLTVGGEMIGLFGFGTTSGRTAWAPDTAALLKIAAEMFANAIERVRSEEAMRSHRDALAHVLRVGTMGQLASGIAHELNQPLSAILSYARGCERRIAAGEAGVSDLREAVRRIAEQAVRAANVIKTFRALVRKGEGRRAWHDANELVRAALGIIEPEIADAGITLQTELRDAIPHVQVDPIQIEQVVLNLVRNAVEALQPARKGSRPKIRVTTSSHTVGGVEVCVADNGPGIDASRADFVFDEFYTTKTDGLGLGLSISRSIIEAHGGKLWFDVGAPQGSAFHFTLPT